MVTSFPGVEYGPLLYRKLKDAKVDGLRLSQRNYTAKIQIDREQSDLTWWIENLLTVIKQITCDNPHHVLRTDASMV